MLYAQIMLLPDGFILNPNLRYGDLIPPGSDFLGTPASRFRRCSDSQNRIHQ